MAIRRGSACRVRAPELRSPLGSLRRPRGWEPPTPSSTIHRQHREKGRVLSPPTGMIAVESRGCSASLRRRCDGALDFDRLTIGRRRQDEMEQQLPGAPIRLHAVHALRRVETDGSWPTGAPDSKRAESSPRRPTPFTRPKKITDSRLEPLPSPFFAAFTGAVLVRQSET